LFGIEDLLGGARVRIDFIHRGHGGHAFAVLLLPRTEPRVLLVRLLLHGLGAWHRADLGVHHDALAIGADDQELALVAPCLVRCWRLIVEGIEILAQLHRDLLGLALRHLPATGAIQMIDRFIERSANDLFHQHLAQSVRILVRRQVELRIQGEDTVQTASSVATAGDDHLPEATLQAPPAACAPMRARNPILADHALVDGLLDTTLVEVPLDQPTQQLGAFGVHHGLQLTMGETLVFLIAESAQQRGWP
jgi:hypothetical protein